MADLRTGGRVDARAAPMSEINVTPMVDVMLVLLIIFMVTAPMLTAGIEVVPQPDLPKVTLPKTEAGPIDAQKQALAITVDPDGKVFLQSTEIGFDELVPKLTAIKECGRGRPRRSEGRRPRAIWQRRQSAGAHQVGRHSRHAGHRAGGGEDDAVDRSGR